MEEKRGECGGCEWLLSLLSPVEARSTKCLLQIQLRAAVTAGFDKLSPRGKGESCGAEIGAAASPHLDTIK